MKTGKHVKKVGGLKNMTQLEGKVGRLFPLKILEKTK